MTRKRKRYRRPRRQASAPRPRTSGRSAGLTAAIHPDFDYPTAIAEADRLLDRNEVTVRPGNWQALALDWLAGTERDRRVLADYVARHEARLGVAWARDVLRLEIFFREEDHDAIIVHHARALGGYPRCALIEMYVGEQVGRHGADWWQARAMLRYAAEHLPDYARPRYELGFHHHLLGDAAGALRWFDEAEGLLSDDDAGFEASRLYYNRGMIRVMYSGDRDAAVADIKQALHHDPGYTQARRSLRALKRGKVQWVPW